MGLLLFKKVFAEAIVSGRKTTTLRRWERARVKAGQRVYAPGIGYLRVLNVDLVTLRQLGEADARADGFASVRALKTALREIYGSAPGSLEMYRVHFAFDAPVAAVSAVGLAHPSPDPTSERPSGRGRKRGRSRASRGPARR